MKAAVLHTPGLPPVYSDHPAPEGGEGITVVRVTAAPVVPLDLMCASGTSYFGVPRTPYVPGGQGVGTVESSATFEPGTRVWFFATAGMKSRRRLPGRAVRTTGRRRDPHPSPTCLTPWPQHSGSRGSPPGWH